MLYRDALNNLKPLHKFIESNIDIRDLEWIILMCDDKLDKYIYHLELKEKQIIFKSLKKVIDSHRACKNEIDFDPFVDFLERHRGFYGM